MRYNRDLHYKVTCHATKEVDTLFQKVAPCCGQIKFYIALLTNDKCRKLVSLSILAVVSVLTALLYKYITRIFSSLAKLDVVQIIQIDTQVILGILILLTLSATGGNLPFGSNAPQLWITTLIIIIPFALSSILVMAREKYKSLGTAFMLAGFVILSTSISLIVASALGPSISTWIGSMLSS